MWVLMKIFRISAENELIYQKNITDREVIELIDSRRRFVIHIFHFKRPFIAAEKEKNMSDSKDKNISIIDPRPIDVFYALTSSQMMFVLFVKKIF